MRNYLFSVAFVTAIALHQAPAHARTYQLYYQGGQSNMDGYGRAGELPEALMELPSE